jgi:aspartokinase
MKKSTLAPEDLSVLAREAKALVAMAFRNGPIENVHAGKACPMCHSKQEYSHITQTEMREIMKSAVDRLYTFLVLKQSDHAAYEVVLSLGERYTTAWDEPTFSKDF